MKNKPDLSIAIEALIMDLVYFVALYGVLFYAFYEKEVS